MEYKPISKTQERITHLKRVAYLLALICDILDLLSVPLDDPRLNIGNHNPDRVTIEIVSTLLIAIHGSFEANKGLFFNKNILDPLQTETCI
jgi:hypothetical protein